MTTSAAVIRRCLAVPIALLLLALGAPAQTSEDVKGQLDNTLRWLRTQQDLSGGGNGGSYGGAVEPTALVLLALAEGPRGYGPNDGPFVSKALAFLLARQRADGAICDAGCDAASAAYQTELAAAAIAALPQGSATDSLARALAYIGSCGSAPRYQPVALPADAQAARELCATILAARSADGTWNGERGQLLATAQAANRLVAVWRALKRGEVSAAPGNVSELPAFAPVDRAEAVAAIEQGARFLLASAKGGALWGAGDLRSTGLSAMVLGALLAVPEPRPNEIQQAIATGLDWLVSQQQPNGALSTGGLSNYVTSAGVLALARGGRPSDRAVIAKARGFLATIQADAGEGYAESDRYYGGVGYGDDERPDLSNTQMALEALAAAGVPPSDATFQKAMAFLQRCQNRSESNDLALADPKGTIKSGNDGGAGYAPGESKADFSVQADGTRVARSYGSMSYALLKCYLLAGLERSDPRVELLWKWLCQHYTLDVNPGFESSGDPQAPYQGLFYYFHTMAVALDLYGAESLGDSSGNVHVWRAELCGRLVSMQQPDGSWVNVNSPRWWEGDPVLATSYALLALDAALPPPAAGQSK